MARVLALEPYYGGSHRAFLDGWQAHSQHDLTLLTLRPHHWKWRMRHSAITLASMCAGLEDIERFDVVWASSMLNLAEFFGTCPAAMRTRPGVVYFHENQLAYPSQHHEPRDVHFAFTQWASLCAARAIWFNSGYNRTTAFDGLASLFHKMPDHRRFDRARFEARSSLLPPGIDATLTAPAKRAPGPLRVTWAARFEHDKGPDRLLQALRLSRQRGLVFRISIMGEQFAGVPPALATLQTEFREQLDHFGFEPDRGAYIRRLQQTDVFVSTARHEFFGLSVMEAAACGCSLLLPNALSYPELFGPTANERPSPFYDDSDAGLSDALARLSVLSHEQRPRYTEVAARYTWPSRAAALDRGIERCLDTGG